MIFALVGNQNCGKTTIFNKITNMKQHIGNFPGVTVDIKIGTVLNITNCEIVDLPGLYSLNTYTKEETISKKFIMEKKAGCNHKCNRRWKYRKKSIFNTTTKTIENTNSNCIKYVRRSRKK